MNGSVLRISVVETLRIVDIMHRVTTLITYIVNKVIFCIAKVHDYLQRTEHIINVQERPPPFYRVLSLLFHLAISKGFVVQSSFNLNTTNTTITISFSGGFI